MFDRVVAYWCSKLYAVLECSYKVRISEFDDVKIVSFLHVLDPLVSLSLRVDHERPATSVARDNTILDRERVCW